MTLIDLSTTQLVPARTQAIPLVAYNPTPTDMDALDARLAGESWRQQLYRTYRSALGPRLLLTEKQAAILATSRDRRGVPISTIIVDAKVHRLSTDEITSADASLQKFIEALLAFNRWKRFQKWVYSRAVRDGDAYVVHTWDADAQQPRWTVRDAFDGSTGAQVFYDPLTGDATFGMNQTKTSDYVYRDLYYPDHIEKWQARANATGILTWEARKDVESEQWPARWVDASGQPLGIAILHWRNDDDGSDYGDSDLKPMLDLQSDLSETVVDARGISRTAGFPIRVIKGIKLSQVVNQQGQALISPATGAPVSVDPKLYFEPGAILDFSKREVDIGQFDAASVGEHLSLIDKLIFLISIVTGLPMHHFGGQWPSGEAQTRSEDRWTANIKDTQDDYGVVVTDGVRLSARIANAFGGARLDAAADIEEVWAPPQPPNEQVQIERQRTDAAYVQALMTAGAMSRETSVRYLHPDWDDSEVQAELDRIEQEGVQQRVGSLFG